MDLEKIIQLLSNHRNQQSLEKPAPLKQHQIIALIRGSLGPAVARENLAEEVKKNLEELQARGEIWQGKGNKYTIAAPTLIASEKSLSFQGDRTYLPYLQNLLGPNLDLEKYQKLPRQQLAGIRLLTLSDLLADLPSPRLPNLKNNQSPWPDNPLEYQHHLQQPSVSYYFPCRDLPQTDRWFLPNATVLSQSPLWRLSTGEYLWYQEGNFYEITPDEAILAMFYLDQEQQLPLTITWDPVLGNLDLKDTILPSSYARWLWHLSQPHPTQYRVRCFPSHNYSLLQEALNRLGINLR